jgi:hypothetical protein
MRFNKPYPTTAKGFFGRAFAIINSPIDSNIEVVEKNDKRLVIRAYATDNKVYEFIRATGPKGGYFYFVDDVTDPDDRKKANEHYACSRTIDKFNKNEILAEGNSGH